MKQRGCLTFWFLNSVCRSLVGVCGFKVMCEFVDCYYGPKELLKMGREEVEACTPTSTFLFVFLKREQSRTQGSCDFHSSRPALTVAWAPVLLLFFLYFELVCCSLFWSSQVCLVILSATDCNPWPRIALVCQNATPYFLPNSLLPVHKSKPK